MKTLQELLALKQSREARLAALLAIIEGANGVAARALTEAEQNELTEIRTGADALETQIQNARFLHDQKAASAARQFEQRAAMGLDPGTGEQREQRDIQKRYSIVRAVQYAAGQSNIDAGLEKEMHQEGVKEARESNINITGKGIIVPSMVQRSTAANATDAGNLIATNLGATVEGYRPKLYVEALGATMHTGLTGINEFPIADLTAQSAFIGEGNAFTDVAATTRKATLTAKGLMSKTTNSWFLKALAGPESDRVLAMTLDAASQNALNACIIKRANTNSSHGIIGAADIIDVSAANGSAFSRDLLISMINSAAKNNAEGDRAGWLVSPTFREMAQKEKTDAGSGLFVWDSSMPGQLLGYNAAVTTLMPSNLTKGSGTELKGAAFGYWNNLHIANWALQELIVDTGSNDNGVVIKRVEFWDWVFANPAAFALAYIV